MFMSFDMGSFPIWHILDNHNHGMNFKVLKYRGPKPYKSPFSIVDLVWKKVSDMDIQTRYPLNVFICHMHMFMDSWKVNEVICIPRQNGTFSKMCHISHQMAIHMTQGCGVILLPPCTHPSKWQTRTWPTWSQIDGPHVTICSTNVSSS